MTFPSFCEKIPPLFTAALGSYFYCTLQLDKEGGNIALVKPKTQDEVAEALKDGCIDLEEALKICYRLRYVPTVEDIDQWMEERIKRKESRREANQLPVVLALGLMLAVLLGAIAWVSSHEVLGKGDAVSLAFAREVGVSSLIIFLIGALVVLEAERRSA